MLQTCFVRIATYHTSVPSHPPVPRILELNEGQKILQTSGCQLIFLVEILQYRLVPADGSNLS